MEKFPDGDKTVIGSKCNSLSEGQKQRLSLGRALYSRRQLLLIDDVTSGLDSVTEQAVAQRVFGEKDQCRKQGLTVLVVTHKI